MADLESRFKKAQVDVKTLTERPNNADLLILYSLYKQASEGDAGGNRPGMFDMVGRAKHDAWAKLKGMSAGDAKKQYVEKVTRLLKT